MAFRRLCTAILLFISLGGPSARGAERRRPPTLREILVRLQANLSHYDADLPSLFCDEHAVSARSQPGPPDETTVTDSIFRLRRLRLPGEKTIVVESREITTINGKPATSQRITGPTLLSGIFEGGLSVVSLEQSPCMNYVLQRIHPDHSSAPWVIRFSTRLSPRNSIDCFLDEPSKGRVFIDPASMQITRLEIVTPHHTINSEGVMGRRELTVDYEPVRLGSETFRIPSAITMQTISGFGFHRIVWSFRATYRNYHRLQVSEQILPVPGPKAP